MEPTYTPNTGIPFNFGPSAVHDEVLFTAERPGNPIITTDDSRVSQELVNEWIAFMQARGIKHVLVLLDDNEFFPYENPGLLNIYRENGLQCYHIPLGGEGAYENVMKILKQVEANGEKVVTHCKAGSGRAGRVAAAWIASRYEMTPEAATREALDAALANGVRRLGNVEKLSKFMMV